MPIRQDPFPPFARRARLLTRLCMAWFVVYFATSMTARRDLFAGTAERVASPWIRAVFLDLRLQLGLVLVATVCLVVRNPWSQRIALVCALLATLLALAHVAISLATA
jgi:hypothetical protein